MNLRRIANLRPFSQATQDRPRGKSQNFCAPCEFAFFVVLVVKSAIVLVYCEYKHWIAATEVVSRSIGLNFNARSGIKVFKITIVG